MSLRSATASQLFRILLLDKYMVQPNLLVRDINRSWSSELNTVSGFVKLFTIRDLGQFYLDD